MRAIPLVGYASCLCAVSVLKYSQTFVFLSCEKKLITKDVCFAFPTLRTQRSEQFNQGKLSI